MFRKEFHENSCQGLVVQGKMSWMQKSEAQLPWGNSLEGAGGNCPGGIFEGQGVRNICSQSWAKLIIS